MTINPTENLAHAAGKVIVQASRPNGTLGTAVTCQVPVALLQDLQWALACLDERKLSADAKMALARSWHGSPFKAA